jgi:hypothetical protein
MRARVDGALVADRLPCAAPACNDRAVHLLLLAQSEGPTGLAHGRFPAPAWAIGLVGAILFALAVVFIVVRARRANKPPSASARPGARP